MSLISNISNILKESRTERIKMVAVALAMIATLGADLLRKYEEKRLKEENQTYEKQAQKLSDIQLSINNLSDFVRTQKELLEESQKTVESLKKEQQALKPVVEADRKVVDSILMLQAEKAKADAWLERLIGFGLGVVSSLVASLIWAGIKRGKIPNKA